MDKAQRLFNAFGFSITEIPEAMNIPFPGDAMGIRFSIEWAKGEFDDPDIDFEIGLQFDDESSLDISFDEFENPLRALIYDREGGGVETVEYKDAKKISMSLQQWIDERFGGVQKQFAESNGVLPQQVTQWLEKDMIVVDGEMYSHRRTLK